MNHLQQVILQIAENLDNLLSSNNIPYSLDGGTALGAVRHKGFIPWDDDFDIILLPEHYEKFVKICREQLDHSKYSFFEAEKDWPMHISKIKLKGTTIKEVDEYPLDNMGIYVDIFCFDYASNIKAFRFFQYLCTRIWVILAIASKPYTALSKKKKIALFIAKRINCKWLRKIFRELGRSHHKTEYLSMAWCRTRSNWEKYFCKRSLFTEYKYLHFENKDFKVTTKIHEYLTICFGNYMQMPPKEKQVGLHVLDVNYGKY